MQRAAPTSSVLGSIYGGRVPTRGMEEMGAESEENEDGMLEHVQRLEEELAEKDHEIQMMKVRLNKDKAVKNSPVYFCVFDYVIGMQSKR